MARTAYLLATLPLWLWAGPAAADAAPCQELSKTVDLSSSPVDDRRVFCAYAKDLVVGACCQSDLHACLIAHPECPRAQVLARIGLDTIAGGAAEEKALAAASNYLGGLPWAKRAKIDLTGAPCRGAGPPTLVEFSDFDCPHCAYASTVLHDLVEKRPSLRFCVMAFPIHPHAELAAAAALFAARHGKYREMSRALYESQFGRVGLEEGPYVDQLVSVGHGVGLDAAALRAALKGGPELDLALAQRAQARALKLEGTPTFVLDGHVLELGVTQLGSAIDDEVAYRKAHPRP